MGAPSKKRAAPSRLLHSRTDSPEVPQRHQLGRSPDQAARIGVTRRIQQSAGLPCLFDLSAIEHHHPVRKGAGEGKVMGNQKERAACLLLQLPQQCDQPGARSGVKRAGRLVENHQRLREGDGAGDQKPLCHPARKTAREAVEIPCGKADPLEQPLRPLRPFAARKLLFQDLVQLGAQGHRGVQHRGCILENDRKTAHPQLALPFQQRLSRNARPPAGKEIRHRPDQGGFAAARFPDNGKRFPRGNGKGNRMQREAVRIFDRQILNLKHRLHRIPPFSKLFQVRGKRAAGKAPSAPAQRPAAGATTSNRG